jgi:phosphate:Na+ symporter
VIIEPEFLDEAVLKAPSIALENARREIERAGLIVLEMMDAFREAFQKQDKAELDNVARRDDEVDILVAETTKYLDQIRQGLLTKDQGATHKTLLAAMMNLESIADIVETEMVGLAKSYLEGELEAPSEVTREMAQGLWDCVRRGVELAVKSVGHNDQRAAQDVLLQKDDVRDLADRLFDRHANRLHTDDPKYLQKVRLLMTFIEQLRHMYSLTKRMAKTQLPVEARQEA